MLKRASLETIGLTIAAAIVTFSISFMVFSSLSPSSTNNGNPTLNPTEVYATVCAVASAQATPYLWTNGTPTPLPPRVPRNTLDPEEIPNLPTATLGTPYALRVGNPARGKVLFEGVGQCIACHARTDDAAPLVGPALAHIGTLGGLRLAGVSTEEYIRASILYPVEYLVPGYAGVMPRSYGEKISPPEIEDLVAYLLSFK